MTPQQKAYFDNMEPGEELHINQVSNPSELIKAGKEYIDLTGLLTFSSDYTKITKHRPIPGVDYSRLSA